MAMDQNAVRGRVLCSGGQSCLCSNCLDERIQRLRRAPLHVIRDILRHLPPDAINTPPLAVEQPNNHRVLGPVSAPAPAPAPAPSSIGYDQRFLGYPALFSLPLWPSNSDAEFDNIVPRHEPSTRNNIIIPPIVEQHIPTIRQCVDYVIANAQITGPSKEAAILESIDEILAICERRIEDSLRVR